MSCSDNGNGEVIVKRENNFLCCRSLKEAKQKKKEEEEKKKASHNKVITPYCNNGHSLVRAAGALLILLMRIYFLSL